MPPSVRAILISVAAAYALPVNVILSGDRTQLVYRARQEAMQRVRLEIKISGRRPSYPLIGRWFGRDHTSVIHACRDRISQLSTGNEFPGEVSIVTVHSDQNRGKLAACI